MTMVRLFLIAAVLVSPFGFVTVRRVLRDRRARSAAATALVDEGPEPDAPPDERDVAVVVARLRAAALDREPGDDVVLVVPEGTTIGGRPAARDLVGRLVVDELQRSGVQVLREDPPGTLHCRRG